jgi:hypothetical protein
VPGLSIHVVDVSRGTVAAGMPAQPECAEAAKEARDPEVKQDFADLARQWTHLVKQAQRQGR